MTVTANTTRNDYTAGSAQSVYNYTFQLNEAADVDVYLDGVKQTLNTHYTVQNIGNASGGTITFTLVDANNNPIHPTQGAIINIVMAMDLDRDTNYQPSGAFLAADVNNDFDRLWHSTNQQQTAINRSLRLQDTDVTTSTMELPLKDDRKGKLLGFNATTGDPEATTNNQTNWDSAYNDTITSASFSGSTLTLGQRDGNSIIATHTPYLPIAGGTLTGDLALGANKLVFPSLEIYGVVGDHSIIKETGSGNLFIHGTDVRIQSAENEDVIKGVANGAVTLYYNNAPKVETTNTGISVTGTLSATGYNDTNWNTAYNDKINAVNYSNNTLTLTQQDGSTLTTTINGGGGGSSLWSANGSDIYYNSGNVGIGTSNPTRALDVSKSGSTILANFKNTGGTSSFITLGNTTSTADQIRVGSNGTALTLSTNYTERMIIDSSGSVLVGTTSVNVYDGTTTGAAITQSGLLLVGKQNDAPAYLNRIGNDGNIINLNKDGQPVGYIGTASGDLYIGTGDTGLSFGDGSDAIVPVSSTSSRDAAIDLGIASNRFKDLYLSGTAYADKVGIGTTIPATDLHVKNTGATQLLIESGETSTGFLLFGDASDLNVGSVSYDHSDNSMRFETSDSERMRINSSGNVGIGTGTTSPPYLLTTNYNANASFTNAASDFTQMWQNSGTNGLGVALADDSTARLVTNNGYALAFNNATSEAMRIDSSGNVLVGTTAANQLGITLRGDSDYIYVARNEGIPSYFDRKSTDGSITEFRKDGQPVGSIGTTSGDIFIGGLDNNHAGIRFAASNKAILPIQNSDGALNDNTTDLGQANARFKDLYLSNKVTNPSGALSVETGGGNQLLLKGSSELVFHTNNTERARFTSSGNLGIGDSIDATEKLEVASTSSVNIKVNNTGNGTSLLLGAQATAARLTAGSGNKLGLGANNTADGLVLDTSNNVGIGTSSPSADLHVKTDATGSGVTPLSGTGLFIEGQYSCALQLGAYWAGQTSINFGRGAGYGASMDADNGQIIYNNYSGSMAFRASGSERARINSYGQLLVGTTSNQDTTSKIVTTGRIRSGNFLASSNNSQFYNSGTQGFAGITLYSYLTNSATTQKMMSFNASNGTEYGAITISGTTVTYGTGSDERLKENIRDAEDAGDKIDAIKIRQFDWKESGQHQDYGVIAQELDEVAPEAVAKGYTEDDMMSVDYSKLVPTLIKEIQSLRNRVAELEKT